MHTCVGRIRYIGVILYDADRIHETASVAEKDLIEHHMSMLMDPFDPEVIASAKANGIADSTIDAAQNSPTYKFVKGDWPCRCTGYRTLPMLFCALLLPVMAAVKEVNNAERRPSKPSPRSER
jgi:nitrate reductase beta subunit